VKNSAWAPGTRAFYDEVDTFRYAEEFHIPQVAEFERYRGARVLEIGGGVGSDGRRFARNGADYVDADLSINSLKVARAGFEVFGLSGRFVSTDAERLPFPSEHFDLVYSHGVLHHTPDTGAAISEVRRVLRPDGIAAIMLYARESLAYFAGVHVAGRARLERLRHRIGDAAFNRLVGLPPGHRGWLPTWVVVNNSTDGVGNPLSRFYSRPELRWLFRAFADVHVEKHYFPRRKIPVVGPAVPRRAAYALGRAIGGYWYVKARK
jgi:SAM-dependent methyltransferase